MVKNIQGLCRAAAYLCYNGEVGVSDEPMAHSLTTSLIFTGGLV